MSGLSDLRAAVTAFQAFEAVVVSEIASLAAAAAAAGDPDAEIETLAQSINASIAAMQAAIPSGPANAVAPSPVIHFRGGLFLSRRGIASAEKTHPRSALACLTRYPSQKPTSPHPPNPLRARA